MSSNWVHICDAEVEKILKFNRRTNILKSFEKYPNVLWRTTFVQMRKRATGVGWLQKPLKSTSRCPAERL
ncbi:hypothetical protein L596_002264 [Steinernema carpocapsae]|uniref:Uncharacterized protein n=1 Tax=Steinernema carpocapsae TaxID=34508 RepID=A0A4U8UP03_STECR|nr:hypothetical protein L596_002264 [Steinernema carpocapsae]